jgi:hypothetical protein
MSAWALVAAAVREWTLRAVGPVQAATNGGLGIRIPLRPWPYTSRRPNRGVYIAGAEASCTGRAGSAFDAELLDRVIKPLEVVGLRAPCADLPLRRATAAAGLVFPRVRLQSCRRRSERILPLLGNEKRASATTRYAER